MKINNKRKILEKLSIYRSVLILLIICIFAAILSPSFLQLVNLFNIFKQITVAAIVACGMTFVILTGGIDLSVGSILGFSGVLASGILEATGNAGLAIAAGISVGIVCGAANSLFVAFWEIPPFISTLGMMTLLRGCILVYTKGSPISVKSDAYKFFGKGNLLGIPVPVVILVLIFVLAHYVLTQTSYGRSVYALGGNREAARLSGIPVKITEWAAYTLNGLMCGIAGVILTARLGSAQSTSGTGIEMDAIAAVILGGTSLSGGVGFVLPTVVGAMIMGIIDNILTLMNVNPHATNIVKGIVILIAVLVDKKVKDLSARVE